MKVNRKLGYPLAVFLFFFLAIFLFIGPEDVIEDVKIEEIATGAIIIETESPEKKEEIDNNSIDLTS